MLIALKIAMLRKGVRQTRMAMELGWDPAKLSRIVNQVAQVTEAERTAIAEYLGEPKRDLFPVPETANPSGLTDAAECGQRNPVGHRYRPDRQRCGA